MMKTYCVTVVCDENVPRAVLFNSFRVALELGEITVLDGEVPLGIMMRQYMINNRMIESGVRSGLWRQSEEDAMELTTTDAGRQCAKGHLS